MSEKSSASTSRKQFGSARNHPHGKEARTVSPQGLRLVLLKSSGHSRQGLGSC